jgi:hypothetical protein
MAENPAAKWTSRVETMSRAVIMAFLEAKVGESDQPCSGFFLCGVTCGGKSV